MVCPGKNDGAALADTLAGVLDRYPLLATVACVPLGVSRFSNDRPCDRTPAARPPPCCDLVEEWQETFLAAIGRRMVSRRRRVLPDGRARPSPPRPPTRASPSTRTDWGWPGRSKAAFGGDEQAAVGSPTWVLCRGGRGPRRGVPGTTVPHPPRHRAESAGGHPHRRVRSPGVGPAGGITDRDDVRLVPVVNHFFGGNIGVSGLLTGTDLHRRARGPARGTPLPPARFVPVGGPVPR